MFICIYSCIHLQYVCIAHIDVCIYCIYMYMWAYCASMQMQKSSCRTFFNCSFQLNVAADSVATSSYSQRYKLLFENTADESDASLKKWRNDLKEWTCFIWYTVLFVLRTEPGSSVQSGSRSSFFCGFLCRQRHWLEVNFEVYGRKCGAPWRRTRTDPQLLPPENQTQVFLSVTFV